MSSFSTRCMPWHNQVAHFLNSVKVKSEIHELALLDDPMAQPNVPMLTRAHLLQWKATLALKSRNFDSWNLRASGAEECSMPKATNWDRCGLS
jgi:hypothetical protein